jgi:hypothetical protein
MVWRIGARVHAFVHGLFKPSEMELVRAQYDALAEQFREIGVAEPVERDEFIRDLAREVATHFAIPRSHSQADLIHELTERLFDYEAMLVLPDIDWTQTRTIAELWDIREELTRQRGFADSFEAIRYTLNDVLMAMLEPLYRACPALLDDTGDDDGITVPTALLQSIGDIGQTTELMFAVAFAEEVTDVGLFTRLRDRLERNLVSASGGNPANPAAFTRAPKLPSQADAKDPTHLVSAYLGGTPLLPLFDQTLDFTIPTKTRFEHHHIVAASGHGKTQTLQYLIAHDLDLIAHDLEAVADGNRTVTGSSQNDSSAQFGVTR